MPEPTPQSFVRPSVVVVIGHIDHGKTTLLDFIRKTKTAASESGGITQAIGAYQIEHQGKKITFLDTPGHEAFSAIRSRGAEVADIAILVVAADDGVKPQTIEALKLISEAKLPFVVAINKIDKPGASADKVKGELAEQNVLVEGWGGTVPALAISALTGAGVAELIETTLLLAEVEHGHTPPPDATRVAGVIIESSLDPRRGALATLIGQQGTLTPGLNLAAGAAFGRVRVLEDWNGQAVQEAPPGLPVRVVGFKEPPTAGERFRAFPTLKEAEDAAAQEKERQRRFEPATITLVSGKREHLLSLVLRADMQGSLEGIIAALRTLPVERVGIEVLKAALGPVTDSDVKLAGPKGAPIVAFRVGVEPQARALAERRGVFIATFDVLYGVIEFVRTRMALTLPAEVVRREIGELAVLALFKKTSQGHIVGGKVIKDKITRGALAEVWRGGALVGSGKILQLQQEKVAVDEAAAGRECGILWNGPPLAIGDTLKAFKETTKAQEL